MPRPLRSLALLPLLALGVSLAWTSTARAQALGADYRRPAGTSTTLQIQFGQAHHWNNIPGTGVDELQANERSDYDMFRTGGSYYVHDNNRWFTSTRETGDFTEMDERNVPGNLANVPRDHWRNYPAQYVHEMPNMDLGPAGDGSTRRERSGDWMDGDGSFRARFRTTPRWTYVRGTRVMDLRSAERPDYDLFRYGGSYYAFRNQRWYMTQDIRASFSPIQRRQVPREFRRIPESHWNDYPDYWSNYRDANRIESTRRRY